MPRGMTIKEYVLRRLNQGETDLKVLARQTRIQFPYSRVGLNHISATVPVVWTASGENKLRLVAG